jgi:hypothetical protein
MSKSERYFQFPLWLLSKSDDHDGLGGSIIRYGTISVGRDILRSLNPEQRKASCAKHKLPASKQETYDLASHLGEDKLNVTLGNRKAAIKMYQDIEQELAERSAECGKEPLVRLAYDRCFDFYKGNLFSVREFRVLMAIYSCIGSKPYALVRYEAIRLRATGCKSEKVRERAENHLDFIPPMLTLKQVRGTVARLHQLGWFAKVTPDPHGRATYYSHRLSGDELREKVFTRKTYATSFAEKERQKNAELAARIKAVKFGKSAGHRSGADGSAEGHREGTFNKNALSKNTENRNTKKQRTSRQAARAVPSLSELEEMGYAPGIAEILNHFNSKLVPLGYLPVNQFSPAVESVCEIMFENDDYEEQMQAIYNEGVPSHGDRTFVRLGWNQY